MGHEDIDQETADRLSMEAAKAFRPRSPIDAREFFTGRRTQLHNVWDAVSQTGLHLVIFGERGVGKTSLANIVRPMLEAIGPATEVPDADARLVVKVNVHREDMFSDAWRRAFDEVYWDENRPLMGFDAKAIRQRVTLRDALGVPDEPTIDDVRRTLDLLRGSVFIFDEFDRSGSPVRSQFTDLIKALSDYSVATTVIVVGVSDTVDDLIQDHASIARALVQVQLPRMDQTELGGILEKASEVLSIRFTREAAAMVVRLSQGLPHYTHLVGLHATRAALRRLSRTVELADVQASFQPAVQQAVQSIRERHVRAVRSAHRDALYSPVLIACAIASSTTTDAMGFFQPVDVVAPLKCVLRREKVVIATFQKHINEFCDDERGAVLERTGSRRAYRYRFSDPLMPPFVFMTAASKGLIGPDELQMLGQDR